MDKFTQFIKEHAAVFIIGAISLITLILVIIVFVLVSSVDSSRKVVIDDIRGNAFILKTDGQVSADKRMSLESGDVIITSSASSVRLAVDKDKYIYIEPETTLYIYYTEIAEKGSVVVNISEGAATCRLDSKLGGNSVFEVRTPNAVVSAEGTVFRTQFVYHDTYSGFSEVKLTDVQCSDGEVAVQLYDDNAEAVDRRMKLAEKKSARLMTCSENARYEYLNSDLALSSLSGDALESLIRIAAERSVGYSLNELNNAYQGLLDRNVVSEPTISTIYPPAESEVPSSAEISAVTTVSTASDSSTETSAVSDVTSMTETVTSPSVTESSVPATTSEMSVTSPTTVIYTVSQSSTQTSQSTTAPVTSTAEAAETTVTTVTEASPIQPAERVTEPVTGTTESEVRSTASSRPSITEVTVPSVSTSASTRPETSVPWWEIVNSAALTG